MDDRDYLQEELQRQFRDLEYERFRDHAVLRNRKMRRRIISLAFVALVLGISGYALSRVIYIPEIAVVTVLSGVFSALALFYLRPSSIDRDSAFSDERFFRDRIYIEQMVDEAVEGLKDARKALEFTEQDKGTVLAAIQAKLESDALQTYVAGIKEIALSRVREETLDDRFQQTRRRLAQEIQDLAKRGNLNLILGILTTIAGLSVLAYTVFKAPTSMEAPALLSHFVPRVSLAILIEVFAYFFLRLYKQSLVEIKYFQNELTNVESKHLALEVAMRVDDPTLRAKLAEVLSRTERNFILEKGQTTVDLERERISQRVYSRLASVVKEALGKSQG